MSPLHVALQAAQLDNALLNDIQLHLSSLHLHTDESSKKPSTTSKNAAVTQEVSCIYSTA